MTRLIFVIPNAIYLPESEGIPGFERYEAHLNDDAVGLSWIVAANSYTHSDEVATLHTADYLIELLKEGFTEEGTAFKEEELCETDAQLYGWLKKVSGYKRINLTEADEDNPCPEVFIFTTD